MRSPMIAFGRVPEGVGEEGHQKVADRTLRRALHEVGIDRPLLRRRKRRVGGDHAAHAGCASIRNSEADEPADGFAHDHDIAPREVPQQKFAKSVRESRNGGLAVGRRTPVPRQIDEDHVEAFVEHGKPGWVFSELRSAPCSTMTRGRVEVRESRSMRKKIAE